MLDLESPDLEMRPRGRRRGVSAPASCYAISDVDGSIATSLLGPRATFPCGDVETFYAISDVDGSIATSLAGGERATFEH